ncbi:LOB domain-containing protein 11-like [Panicum virgatum]|uniref:LOB domain-containing protein 11-like n=1 Tax=Panicum virgatum TaxID=38727 RepID=UPI0019D63457|nr:LOB domain-containing protein 11-like [Panicum virgatum]
MSAPPAPPTWSPPSGGATGSELEPDSPSSDGTSSPRAPPTGTSSIASSSTPPATGPGSGGGGSPPPRCAVCRHKRQRCPPGCALAPYFPADDPDRFRSVHRVFGVRNLLRALREVPRPRWDACVRTLVHEARMRLADPVRGCVGAIEDLEAQLVDTAVELEVLRRRQEAYRQAKKRRGLRWFRPADPGNTLRVATGDGRARRDAGTAFPDAAASSLLLGVGDDRAHRDAATTLRDAAATTIMHRHNVLANLLIPFVL